jgi:hypothetical protein
VAGGGWGRWGRRCEGTAAAMSRSDRGGRCGKERQRDKGQKGTVERDTGPIKERYNGPARCYSRRSLQRFASTYVFTFSARPAPKKLRIAVPVLLSNSKLFLFDTSLIIISVRLNHRRTFRAGKWQLLPCATDDRQKSSLAFAERLVSYRWLNHGWASQVRLQRRRGDLTGDGHGVSPQLLPAE